MCIPEDYPEHEYDTPEWLRAGSTNGGVKMGAASSESSASEGRLIVERMPITYEGYTYPHGHIAYIEGAGPKPVILVHPNYAGLKQFDIDQCCFLARCGYAALCVDHYQESELYTFEDRNPRRSHHAGTAIPLDLNTDQRTAARRHGVGAFTCMNDALQHPKHWRGLMRANLEMAWAHPAVESGLAGAIGYCFGGQACIEHVRAGHPLQAVVSFHGLLHSKPLKTNEDGSPNFNAGRISDEEYETKFFDDVNTYDTDCKVLIENGDLDDEVPQSDIDKFKDEMDAHGVDWRFNNHAQTPHGFALAAGVWSTAYHEAADRRSTLSMLSLFAEVWPQYPQNYVAANACGTVLGQAILTGAKL